MKHQEQPRNSLRESLTPHEPPHFYLQSKLESQAGVTRAKEKQGELFLRETKIEDAVLRTWKYKGQEFGN